MIACPDYIFPAGTVAQEIQGAETWCPGAAAFIPYLLGALLAPKQQLVLEDKNQLFLRRALPHVKLEVTLTVFLQHPQYLCFKVSQQIEELTLSHWMFYSDRTEINGHPRGWQRLNPQLHRPELNGMWKFGASLFFEVILLFFSCGGALGWVRFSLTALWQIFSTSEL